MEVDIDNFWNTKVLMLNCFNLSLNVIDLASQFKNLVYFFNAGVDYFREY